MTARARRLLLLLLVTLTLSFSPGRAQTDFPASFDWQDEGIVPPVRNQGECANPWALTITAMLESAITRDSGQKVNLSEQYLLNCNTHGFTCDQGGWEAHDAHISAFQPPQSAAGAVLESALPYTGRTAACTRAYAHPYRAEGWAYVNPAGATTEEVKRALLEHGPLGTSLCAGPYFKQFNGWYFTQDESPDCLARGSVTNASVLLVGWEESGCWIAQATRGTGWGTGGYACVKFGVSAIGKDANYVLYRAAPGQVTALAPASGAVSPTLSPVFAWKPAAGTVDGYRVEVAANSAFESILATCETTALTCIPGSPLPANRLLYWRVQALRGLPENRLYGPVSLTRSLKTLPEPPLLLAPASGETVESIRPEFSWQLSGGALRYEVQICRDSTCAQRVISTSGSGEWFTPSVDLPRDAQLFWRVRQRGMYGAGPWSETGRSFFTRNPPPAPALLKPLSGQVLAPGQPITLGWATPHRVPDLYQWQVTGGADFSSPLASGESRDPGADTAFLPPPNRLYSWRVRSCEDVPRACSAWSTPRQFKTLPETAVPLAPVDAPVSSLRPELTWDAPEGLRFDVQIARAASTCGSVIRTASVSSGRAYLLPADLPRSAALYWRVRARGLYGASAWSACTPFQTPNPPAAPLLLSPGSGSTLPLESGYRPVMTWRSSPGAASYELQLSARSSFSDSLERSVPEAFYSWEDDLPVGVYYWRVKACDAVSCSGWSAARSFKTLPGLTGLAQDGFLQAPLAGLTVRVNGATASAETQSDGSFMLAPLPAGTRTITVSGPDIQPYTRTVSLTAGVLARVTLNVTRLPLRIEVETPAGAGFKANLWLPEAQPLRLWSSRPGVLTGFPYARLSSQAVGTTQVQVIEIAKRYGGVYRVGIEAPVLGAALPGSGAQARVYLGAELVHTLAVPAGDEHNRWWHVLDFNGATGEMIPVNQLKPGCPGAYSCTQY